MRALLELEALYRGRGRTLIYIAIICSAQCILFCVSASGSSMYLYAYARVRPRARARKLAVL